MRNETLKKVADVFVLNTINHRGGFDHEGAEIKKLMQAINALRPGNADANWDEKAARKNFMDAWRNFDHSKVEAILEDKTLPRKFEAVVEEKKAKEPEPV